MDLFSAWERAARGADLLDRVTVGWHLRVDPVTLDMGDSRRCVLSQLYERMRYAPVSIDAGPEHGFVHQSFFPLAIFEYQLLNLAWRKQIRKRCS